MTPHKVVHGMTDIVNTKNVAFAIKLGVLINTFLKKDMYIHTQTLVTIGPSLSSMKKVYSIFAYLDDR